MALRIKIKLKYKEKELTTIALVNSGFITETPDIAIPLEIAKKLKIWPLEKGEIIELSTGGGEVEAFMVREAVVLESADRPDKRFKVNVIINNYIDEVLLSDYVAGELGIVILDLKKGLWRFSDEETVRESE